MAGFIQVAKEMTIETMVDLLLLIQIFHDSRTSDRGSLFYAELKKNHSSLSEVITILSAANLQMFE